MTGIVAAKGVICVGDQPGPSAPQAVGFAPRALVLWWSCQGRDGGLPGNRGGIGFAVPGSGGGSIAWVSEDGAASARTASWAEESAIVGLADATAEAPDLRAEVDFGESGFVLRVLDAWAAWRVHYLAVGGVGVRASAGWLSAPRAPGDQRIGLGFRPDLVLFASAAVDGRSALTRGLSIALGAATGREAQASAACASPDGAPPGSVGGAQRADAAIVAVAGRTTIDALAGVQAFDPEGVSLTWRRTSSIPREVLYLGLAGARCHVGSARSPTEPRRRRVRGIGLDPRGLLCFSWGLGASADPSDIGRLSLGGASSPSESGAASWDDRDTEASVTATHVRSSTEEVILVSDTQTGGLHAAARLAGFDRGGFTLDWSRSDGSKRQFLYVALGAPRRSRMRTAAARLLSLMAGD